MAEVGRSLGLTGHPDSLTYLVGSKSRRDHFPKRKSEGREGGRSEGGRKGWREERSTPNSVCMYMKFPKIHRVGRGVRVRGDEKEEGVYVDSF